MKEYSVHGIRGGENRFKAEVVVEDKDDVEAQFLKEFGVIDESELEDVREARDYDEDEWLEKQERNSEWEIREIKSAGV